MIVVQDDFCYIGNVYEEGKIKIKIRDGKGYVCIMESLPFSCGIYVCNVERCAADATK